MWKWKKETICLFFFTQNTMCKTYKAFILTGERNSSKYIGCPDRAGYYLQDSGSITCNKDMEYDY